MANTPTRMARAELGTADAPLFTVPASTTSIVTEIVAVNTTDAPKVVTIRLAGMTFVPGVTLDARSMLTVGLKQVLSAAEAVSGSANAAGVNVFISGVNVSG